MSTAPDLPASNEASNQADSRDKVLSAIRAVLVRRLIEASPSSRPSRSAPTSPSKLTATTLPSAPPATQITTSMNATPKESGQQAIAETAAKAPKPPPGDSSAPPVPKVDPFPAPAAHAQRAASARAGSARCPVCDKAPFHLRYRCPVITAGAQSIQNRIAELKKGGSNKRLVRELEILAKKAQMKAARMSSPAQADGKQAGLAPVPTSPEIPILSTLPAGSTISEVVVEAKDDGSSDESSSDEGDDEHGEGDEDGEDDEDEDGNGNEAQAAPASSSSSLGIFFDGSLNDVDIQAILRGPVSSKSVLEMIASSSSSSDNDSDEDKSEEPKLAAEEEEREERKFRRVSRRLERDAPSSDEEREPEEFSPEPAEGVRATAMDVDVDAEVPVSVACLVCEILG